MADGNEASNDLIEEFMQVTGSSEDVARNMLSVCNGNLEMAINMQMDSTTVFDDQSLPAANRTTSVAAAHPTASSSAFNDEDEVRAPIPQVRQVLVDAPFQYGITRPPPRGTKAAGSSSVFDGFRNFARETEAQERRLLGNEDDLGSRKKKTLEDLFRPPLDLMHKGSFESARELGRTSNRWLMVNVINCSEFACQVLNRDVFSNQAVKSIVKEHFVYWQVYHDSAEGTRYNQYYNVHEYPHVAILDPRTGEKLIVWSRLDACSFCDKVTDFLTKNPCPDTTVTPPIKRHKSEENDDSEEAMIRRAIEASLKETSTKTRNDSDDENDSSEIETFESDGESQDATKMNGRKSPALWGEGKSALREGGTSTAHAHTDDLERASSVANHEASCEEWRMFLGDSQDEKTELMLRYPDGSRSVESFPSTSRLKALLLFIASKGYRPQLYEVVTNFPRRNISELDSSLTLKDVGLFPKETVFVQAIS